MASLRPFVYFIYGALAFSAGSKIHKSMLNFTLSDVIFLIACLYIVLFVIAYLIEAAFFLGCLYQDFMTQKRESQLMDEREPQSVVERLPSDSLRPVQNPWPSHE